MDRFVNDSPAGQPAGDCRFCLEALQEIPGVIRLQIFVVLAVILVSTLQAQRLHRGREEVDEAISIGSLNLVARGLGATIRFVGALCVPVPAASRLSLAAARRSLDCGSRDVH